jgi:hypothetical protein
MGHETEHHPWTLCLSVSLSLSGEDANQQRGKKVWEKLYDQENSQPNWKLNNHVKSSRLWMIAIRERLEKVEDEGVGTGA